MENQSTTESPKNRRFSARGFTSLLLTLSLLVLVVSGVVLFLTPRGRVAHWTDWTMLGLRKEQWGALHMNGSILFVFVAVLHLVLNGSMFLGYLRRKAVAGLYMKKEMAVALVVALACTAGTIADVPPFSSILALNHDVKNYWEQRVATAPVPHAEELTLVEFAGQIDLSPDELARVLHEEGFDADDVEVTVGEVGRRKGVAPNAVLAAVQKHYPAVGRMTGGRGGRGFGQGFGRGRRLQGESSPQNDHEADSCSSKSGAHDSESASDCSGDSGEGFGPGRGMGLGQGRGMGMGRGRGMGFGRGAGRGFGQGESCADEHETEQE
jgi:hypothetical protein